MFLILIPRRMSSIVSLLSNKIELIWVVAHSLALSAAPQILTTAKHNARLTHLSAVVFFHHQLRHFQYNQDIFFMKEKKQGQHSRISFSMPPTIFKFYMLTNKHRDTCARRHLDLDSQLPSLISLFIFVWSISEAEANPNNNWMRGEQACLFGPLSKFIVLLYVISAYFKGAGGEGAEKWSCVGLKWTAHL